jgi:hypothetical protein
LSDLSSPPDHSRFVLDQNFPWQATTLPWPRRIELVRLEDIDARLTAGVEDWEILASLAQRGDVAGFVTNDARMLGSLYEMIVLQHTRLVLVVTDSVGHDPLRATGLLMVHLSDLAGMSGPMTAKLYPNGRQLRTPGQRINDIAGHRNTSPQLIQSEAIRDLKPLMGEEERRILGL